MNLRPNLLAASLRCPTWRGARTHAALIVIALQAGTASATACPSPWHSRTGTAVDDEIHAAVADDEGNLYLGGFENGLLGVENNWPVGDAHGFVEKHAPDGHLLWRQTFDTPGIDLVETLALDLPRRRLAVAGRTDGALAGPNAGQLDLFVATLDIDTAAVESIGQFGDQYPQHPRKIAVLPSGHLVVAGSDDDYLVSRLLLGAETMFVAGFATDPHDPSALVQTWWRQPNEPGTMTPISRAFAVTPAGDGSEDVVVGFSSFASDGGSSLQRLDGAGNVVWSRSISPSPIEAVVDLATANARVYAAGVAAHALAGPAFGNFDGFVMEIDPTSGAPRWGRQFGSPGTDALSSLAIGGDGEVFVAGWTDDVVVPGRPATPNSTYVLSFSADGAPRAGWQQAATAVHDFVDSLVVVPACAGAVLVAGDASGDLPDAPPLGRNDAVVLPATLSGFGEAIFASGFE